MNLFNNGIITILCLEGLKDKIKADIAISQMEHKPRNRSRLFVIKYELKLFEMR